MGLYTAREVAEMLTAYEMSRGRKPVTVRKVYDLVRVRALAGHRIDRRLLIRLDSAILLVA